VLWAYDGIHAARVAAGFYSFFMSKNFNVNLTAFYTKLKTKESVYDHELMIVF